jgi:hypothetical protein
MLTFWVDSNTTLPHPEAKTAPGEELNTDIIDVNKGRSRLGIFGRNQGRKNGPMTDEMSGSIEYADNSPDVKEEGLIRRNIHKMEEKLHLRKSSA